MDRIRFNRVVLIVLLVIITVLFVVMIRPFLIAILLAAVFAGLASPLYSRILHLVRGRKGLASLTTILLLLLVVLIPLLALLGIVVAEAYRISDEVRPWITERIENPEPLLEQLERIPGMNQLAPYRTQILTKVGEIIGHVGTFLVDGLSAATRGTVGFLFQLFVMLYAIYFFLSDGRSILRRILYYLPLEEVDEQRMVEKFVSVTRATLKGTLLIGIGQGALGGVAFWIVGISGAVFWGTLMTVLSIIPGIGTGLIWAPAAIILLAIGQVWQGLFLILFCGLVVGSVDNLIRPRVVGRDVKMHELLILFGTLGGIILFGVVGFIIGPILAALFVTIWEIYGHAFRDLLPAESATRQDRIDNVDPGGSE